MLKLKGSEVNRQDSRSARNLTLRMYYGINEQGILYQNVEKTEVGQTENTFTDSVRPSLFQGTTIHL